MATPELAAIEFESPGRYHLDKTQQPMPAKTPEASAPEDRGALQVFDSREQARRHTLALFSQARHSLCLYSPDLEPWLYDQADIEHACKRFLLTHPRNRLRILLSDPTPAVKQGHRLLKLARRLTSSLQVRTLNAEYPVQPSAFLVVDHCGLLVRPEPERLAGYALYQSPGKARALRRQFDSAWEHSLSHPDLRSFLL